MSSLAVARTREALFNSWDKNDPKDAHVILHLLKNGTTQRYLDPLVTGHHDVQEMANTYQQVSLRKVRLHHSLLTHHLPLYFPEAEQVPAQHTRGVVHRAAAALAWVCRVSDTSDAIRMFRICESRERSDWLDARSRQGSVAGRFLWHRLLFTPCPAAVRRYSKTATPTSAVKRGVP